MPTLRFQHHGQQEERHEALNCIARRPRGDRVAGARTGNEQHDGRPLGCVNVPRRNLTLRNLVPADFKIARLHPASPMTRN